MPFPDDRYLTFYGPIRMPTTTSLRSALTGMVNEGARNVTVLFSSEGGSTDDGIALYTFLRALPLKLTFHAIGNVASIAIPVFLAADKRLASENAHFFFHEYSFTHGQPSTVTQTTMEEHALIVRRALDWSKGVIKARTKLTDESFEAEKMFDHPILWGAARAAKAGIVTAVREPAIPADSQPRVVT